MKIFYTSLLLLLSLGMLALAQDKPASEEAQQEELTYEDIKESFPSAQNQGLGKLGSQATIELKEGLVFLNGQDGDKLLQSWGNLPTPMDGLIMNTDGSWVITFTFSDIGYVEDSEKEDIDAEEILDQKKEDQKEANKMRNEQGLGSLEIVKWAVPPYYNSETNNLEWAMLLRDDDGSETINHEIRLLGRRGVMNATLLCSPEDFERLQPIVNKTLEGYTYVAGNQYGEYKEGDKIAEYGLLGLMGAGGAFVIWKFWKPIAAGLVAAGVAVKKIFGRFFGGSGEGRIS